MAYINPFKSGNIGIKTKYVNPFIGGEVAAQVQTNDTFAGTKEIVSGLLSDPLSLKADPMKAISSAWNTIKDSVQQEKENIKNLFESKSISEGIGHGLETVAGGAGVVFSPLSAIFSGGEQIPVLGSVSKIINTAFSALGEGGAGITGGIVDQLPLSQEIKDNIKPGIEQIGALVAQVAAGKLAHSVLKSSKVDPLKSKDPIIKKLAKENPNAKEIIELADQVLERQKTETVEAVKSIEPVKPIEKLTNPLAQEATKYKTAEEFVSSQFAKKPEYGMSHRPSYEGMPPSYNLLEGETLPRDVYAHPDYSISTGRIRSGDKAANESWVALQKIKDKPNAEITVYRAGRENKLNSGDWVTFSKDYAKQSLEGTEKVYSFKVKAKDVIFAGDDINEFGYYPKSQLTDIWNEANKAKLIDIGIQKPTTPSGLIETLKERTGLEMETPELPVRAGKAPIADEFVKNNFYKAKDIINEKSTIPPEVDLTFPEIYSAMAKKAAKEGDQATLHDLAYSAAPKIAREAGQIVQAFDTKFDYDPIKAVRYVDEFKETAVKSKNKNIEQVKKTEITRIKEEVKKSFSTKKSLIELGKQLQC